MSIHSIGNALPTHGFAQPQPREYSGRRSVSVTDDGAEPSWLTAEDREVVAAMFGPDLLTTGRDVNGEFVGVPPFVHLLTQDRRTGRLPIGSEVTSSYLEAVLQRHVLDIGARIAPNPLPDRELAAALRFLQRRRQGATVDVRA
jgi:hypothetical protein